MNAILFRLSSFVCDCTHTWLVFRTQLLSTFDHAATVSKGNSNASFAPRRRNRRSYIAAPAAPGP